MARVHSVIPHILISWLGSELVGDNGMTHRRHLAVFAFFVTFLALPLSLLAADSAYVPPHDKAVVLFDGKDLINFDSFLKSKGLNSDPDHVFTLANGVIHISGAEFWISDHEARL